VKTGEERVHDGLVVVGELVLAFATIGADAVLEGIEE
jgi:hypothetical protein